MGQSLATTTVTSVEMSGAPGTDSEKSVAAAVAINNSCVAVEEVPNATGTKKFGEAVTLLKMESNAPQLSHRPTSPEATFNFQIIFL